MRYVVLVLLAAWVVWYLWSRERRRRLDEGFQRAAIVISLAFVVVGAAIFVRAMIGTGQGAGQALFMIVVGLVLVAYQRWGR
ncbi:MAG: hypothetical protein ACE5HA_09075 [Anaerolineae bacterium]